MLEQAEIGWNKLGMANLFWNMLEFAGILRKTQETDGIGWRYFILIRDDWKWLKFPEKTNNGQNYLELSDNAWNRLNIAGNSQLGMAGNDFKVQDMAGNGRKRQ